MRERVGNLVRILLISTVILISVRGAMAKFVISELDRLVVEVEYLKKTFDSDKNTFEFQQKLTQVKTDIQIVNIVDATGPYITVLVVMCLTSAIGCIIYLYTLYL